jgi:DNA-binding NtrC family response regulator
LKASQCPVIPQDTEVLLQNYSWPGNLRELKNLLERAFLLCSSNVLTPDLFPIQKKPTLEFSAISNSLVSLREMELNYLKHVLATVNNNYSKAAEILGVNRNTIYNRLREK